MKQLLPILLLVASSSQAATYLVAPDDEMIRASKAVVVATAVASHPRWAAGGWIETVTTMRVDEAIAGPFADGQTFDLVEPGGVLDGRGYFAAGAPQFAAGERALLLLENTDRGDWTTKSLSLGRFAFEGRHLVRHDVSGWDETGAPHREPLRDAELFLDYTRNVVRGRHPRASYTDNRQPITDNSTTSGAPTITSYLLLAPGDFGVLGIRWPTFPTPVVYRSVGTQPGALNGGVTAIQRAVASWTNDPGSNVVLQYGGITSGTALRAADGVNSIQLNDPANEIPGGFTGKGGETLGVATGWFATKGAGAIHSYGGERFYSITEADLVVQNGLAGAGLSGNGFDHIITHEMGHTIGLRHSDEPMGGGNGTFSTDAVMFSTCDFDRDPTGSALLSWDREALAAVYGATSTCTPPTITRQPQSQDLEADPVTLALDATGSEPLQLQWYTGARGNTTQPIASATQRSITVKPPVTTSYWARVTNGCAPAADSDTAVVTVNGCPAVEITSVTQSTTIVQGRGTGLLVIATGGGGLRYQWYVGPSSDTTRPIPGATMSTLGVTPLETTSYWAQVTNDCGASANSETITITLEPCIAPRLVVPPAGGDVVSGDAITLYAEVTGTAPLTLRWYEGEPPHTEHPAPNGNGQSIMVGPVTAPASYWLRASNDCGTVDSAAARVEVVSACAAPAIVDPPRDTTVTPGKSAELRVVATGTSLIYQWYEGPVLDFTRPHGGSSPLFATPLIDTPAQFWVRVSNACGVANSAAVTVSPVIGRRRPRD